MTLLLGLACYRAEDPACQPSKEVKVEAVVSPSNGVVITDSPWIPILIRTKRDRKTVQTCLDGRLLDTTPVMRSRANALGGRADVIDALDTEGLAPGPHRLDWKIDGQWFTSEFRYEPPPHTVHVRVQDSEGQPVQARVVLTQDGERFKVGTPDAQAADPRRRDSMLASVFIDGERDLHLEAGTYRLLAMRGIRDSLDSATVEVDGESSVTLTVDRVMEPFGTMAADLHMHTAESIDSFVGHGVRAASLLASGLDAVVLTDHGRVTLPLEQLVGLATMPGMEKSLKRDGKGWAHINAFPLASLPDLPEGEESVALLLQLEDPPILQLNHPRGIHFKPDQPAHGDLTAFFGEKGLDPTVPVTLEEHPWLAQYEAVEVLNRFSFELYVATRADWFALMNQGFFLTGTGNSDSHATEVELAGLPCNLVACAEDDLDCLIEKVSAGEVSASTGPVVDLLVEDARPGQLISARDVTVQVHLQAADWVLVDELRLIVNGQVVEIVPIGTFGTDSQHSFSLSLDRDSWILAEAGWPLELDVPQTTIERLGDYALVAPGYVPVGFANPVRVDVDGDGVFTPPGLP